MKHASAVFVFVCLSARSFAQCGMTTDLAVQVGCSFTSVMVNTTGGTAPYSIVVDRKASCAPQWWNAHSYVNDADGDLLLPFTWGTTWMGFDVGRVTITDALGCTAVYTTPVFTTVFHPLAFLSSELDCVTGQYRLLINSTFMTILLSHYNYSVDGGATLPINGNWTPAPFNNYRSNFTVAPGPHTVSLTTPGGVPYSCSSSVPGCFQTETINVPNTTITPGDCGANVSIRTALQGALPSGSLMHDSLRVKGLIPTTEPYSGLGYTYTAYSGATTISPTLLTTTGNNAIADWVVVELRNSANSAQALFSKPALLQRDGDVVDLDGDSYVNFPSASGNYYVALRHRNHLGIMTSTIRNLTATPTAIDFRLNSTACYGTNARVQVGTVWCMWAGNANGDSEIKYTGLNNDRDPILQAIGGVVPTNTLNNVYDRRDTNMDGTVKYTGLNNDRDIILQNIGGVVPTNTRVQQLP